MVRDIMRCVTVFCIPCNICFGLGFWNVLVIPFLAMGLGSFWGKELVVCRSACWDFAHLNTH